MKKWRLLLILQAAISFIQVSSKLCSLRSFSLKNKKSIHSKQALKVVFDNYYKALVRYAIQFIASENESKDLVQDVFISLWEKQLTFENETALSSYLYVSVKNKCLNSIKHKSIKERYDTHIIEKLSSNRFSEETVCKEEVTRQLNQAILTLSERRQEVIRLSLKGLKNNEISLRLNIKLQTVKTIKSEAYKCLRLYFKNKSV